MTWIAEGGTEGSEILVTRQVYDYREGGFESPSRKQVVQKTSRSLHLGLLLYQFDSQRIRSYFLLLWWGL
jgi:hypothetical protein